MCNMEDLKKKEEQLLAAFKDPDFEKELIGVRLKVEEGLRKFIVYLKARLNEEQKVYDNIESRVKNVESFKEKIHRKDYIKVWEVSDNKTENQKVIAANLPDLIGFRINCFFWQDEEVIYKALKEYNEQGKFSDIELNFSENTKQQNGHNIYKLSGIYRSHYCFEIQIKSIMHNIWGEVEHKAIYKNRNYEANISNKKAITEEVFNILRASDKQLVCVFKKQNDEKQLIYALFYEKTKKVVSDKIGTDILAKHYNGYFEVFVDSDNFMYIKQYVAHSLLGDKYTRKSVELGTLDVCAEKLTEQIKSEFMEYNLKCLYFIYEIIYDISDFDSFVLYLSEYLLEKWIGKDEKEDENDAFEDSDEENVDYLQNALTFLEDKIGGRKKNG